MAKIKSNTASLYKIKPKKKGQASKTPGPKQAHQSKYRGQGR